MTVYMNDATGRLVKEDDKVYLYGWLDKILNVQENGTMLASFGYHINGQIAAATRNGKTENFLWDGLALIHRDGTNYVNEPYVTGGNPVLADNKVLFKDILSTKFRLTNHLFKGVLEVKRIANLPLISIRLKHLVFLFSFSFLLVVCPGCTSYFISQDLKYANLAYDAGYYDSCIFNYERVIENTESNELKGFAYFGIAKAQLKKGNKEKTYEALKKSISFYDVIDSYVALGNIYFSGNQEFLALPYYTKALSLMQTRLKDCEDGKMNSSVLDSYQYVKNDDKEAYKVFLRKGIVGLQNKIVLCKQKIGGADSANIPDKKNEN